MSKEQGEQNFFSTEDVPQIIDGVLDVDPTVAEGYSEVKKIFAEAEKDFPEIPEHVSLSEEELQNIPAAWNKYVGQHTAD